MIEKNSAIHESYREIWNYNIQKLDELHKKIDLYVNQIQSQMNITNPIFSKLEEVTGALIRLYGDFNTIEGQKDIAELYTYLKKYNHKKEALDFDYIQNIIRTIHALKDKSFEYFPEMKHKSDSSDYKKTVIDEKAIDLLDGEKSAYKWITFERHCSYFIIPFKKLKIYDMSEFKIEAYPEPGLISIRLHNKTTTIKDILFPFRKSQIEPPQFVIAIDSERHFIASVIKKRLFAEKDIILPRVQSFPSKRHKISPGRIRIFGKHHIYLY